MNSISKCLVGLVVTLATLPGLAAGVDGKWNATVDGGPAGPVELTFDLKAEGEKLTGSLSVPMMPAPVPISEGTVKADDVAFKLELAVMEGAPPIIITYKGKVKGDELALDSVVDMGQGPMETKVLAKRVK